MLSRSHPRRVAKTLGVGTTAIATVTIAADDVELYFSSAVQQVLAAAGCLSAMVFGNRHDIFSLHFTSLHFALKTLFVFFSCSFGCCSQSYFLVYEDEHNGEKSDE